MSSASLEVNKEIVLTLEKSKEHLESLFEKMVDAWFVYDPKGNLVKANEAACQLLGTTRDYYDARNVFQVFRGHEDLLRAKMKTVRAMVPVGRSVQFELRVQGSPRPSDYIWSLRAIRPGNTRKTYFILSGRDITESKHYETILRTIFSSLRMAIFIVDRRGSIEHNLTQFTEVILGTDKIEGQSFRDLVLKPSYQHLTKDERSYAEQIIGSLGEEEVWYSMVKERFPKSLFRPGKVPKNDKWLGLHYCPINFSGEATKILIIAEDQTEFMRSQREKLEEERAIHEIAKRIVQVQNCPEGILSNTLDDIGALLLRGDTAFESGDVAELCNALHGIKSSARNVGFTALITLTHDLEAQLMQRLKKKNPKLSAKDNHEYLTLKKEIKELRHLFESFSHSTPVVDGKETGLLLKALEEVGAALDSGDGKAALKLADVAKASYDKRTQSKLEDLGPSLAYLVANTSQDQGKKCRFLAKLGEGRISKKQALDIKEALAHVLNNAVAHGLEGPEERKQSGKSPEGEIAIEADLHDRMLTLLVSDDGGGINTAKLKESIVQSGLSSREEVEQMSNQEVWDYIFRPQLSTRNEVDGISGRGIGMAAVRSVLKLYGDHAVDISSEPGQGTKMRFKFSL